MPACWANDRPSSADDTKPRSISVAPNGSPVILCCIRAILSCRSFINALDISTSPILAILFRNYGRLQYHDKLGPVFRFIAAGKKLPHSGHVPYSGHFIILKAFVLRYQPPDNNHLAVSHLNGSAQLPEVNSWERYLRLVS